MTSQSDQGGFADLLDFATDFTTLAATISFTLGLWLCLSALSEARRVAETITRRMGDQLRPGDLALIRTVRDVMPETD